MEFERQRSNEELWGINMPQILHGHVHAKAGALLLWNSDCRGS